MKGTRATSPVFLSTQNSFAIPAQNNVAVPSGDQQFTPMVNMLQVPIEIGELLINYGSALLDQTGNSVGVSSDFYTNVMMRLGRRMITNGFVPVEGLSPLRDLQRAQTSPDGTAIYAIDYSIRWVLPRPLILAPGESIAGAYSFDKYVNPSTDSANGGSIYFNVVARGRRYEGRTPNVRCLPYASGCRLGPLTGRYISADKVFENTFRMPIIVTDFVTGGRNGSASATALSVPITILGPGGLVGRARRTIVSAMQAAPVFAGRGALEEEHALNPGDFYTVTLGTSTTDATVCMLGYREE